MAKTQNEVHKNLREKVLTDLIEYLTEKGEEVLRTGSQQIAMPCVDEAGDDKFITITLSVPTGSRDGDAYDGYSVAEEYAMKVKSQAEKAAKAKADKERKIAKDKAKREQLAKAKAERTEKGEGV